MNDFSWKSRKKETSWKVYGVNQRFMLSGLYRNEELMVGNLTGSGYGITAHL
jgi:hypothetical protein